MPQHAAGTRSGPPVSDPSATSASPDATAAAEPLDDPPGIKAGSSGLAGVPNHGLVPSGSMASSCRFVLPTIRAPAARAPARHAASAAAGAAVRSTAGDPAVVGTPATSMMSLTASRGPVPVVSSVVMNMLMVSPGRSPNAVTGTLRAGTRPGIGRTPDLLPVRRFPGRGVRMDELSLGELVALLTLGQDSSFGQPLESQMRSTLLAIWLAGSAGLSAEVRDTAYWCAQLRYLGCTAHAHEVSAMFDDDIETRARTLTYDASNPAEVLRDAVTYGQPGKKGMARVGAVVSILAGGSSRR